MNKLNGFVKLIIGKNKEISEDMTIGYLFFRGVPFAIGLCRGVLRSIGLKKHGKKLFIGNHVKLLSKQKMFFGSNVRIGNFVEIDALSQNGVVLEDNVKLGDYSKIIGSGSISHVGKGIRIGSNTSFSEYTFFGAAGGIDIGSNIISGQNVRFHAENHNYSDTSIPIREQGVTHEGIKIGNDCWIGAGATFLDGAEIGNGCVVAANSLVNKKFPDNVVIGGVPARILKIR